MPENLGPELEVVGDAELQTPRGSVDFKRATEALAGLTAAVAVLKEQIDKDEPLTPEQLQQAQAAAAAAGEVVDDAEKAEGAEALRALGAKAAMMADELGDGDVDPEKMAAFVEELTAMVQGLAKSEADPEAGTPGDSPAPAPAGDQEEKRAPADVLKAVAEAALGLASKIDEDSVVSSETVGSIDELIAKMEAFIKETEITKADNVALAIENASELGAVAKGVASFLRDTASRAGTLSATIGDEISDVAKKEIGWVCAALHAVKSCVPDHIAKSDQSFQSTVQTVAERALFLSRKMASVEDVRTQKETEQLLGLMSSLVDKYADRKEAGFDLSDYNVVIDVDRKLNAIEDVVRKAEEAAEPAAPAPATPEAPAPVAPEAKSDTPAVPAEPTPAPAVGDDADAQSDADAQDLSKALMGRIEQLTEQVTGLQSFITKARGTVPSPAADGEPDSGGGGDVPTRVLFPMDYNDSADADLDTEE